MRRSGDAVTLPSDLRDRSRLAPATLAGAMPRENSCPTLGAGQEKSSPRLEGDGAAGGMGVTAKRELPAAACGRHRESSGRETRCSRNRGVRIPKRRPERGPLGSRPLVPGRPAGVRVYPSPGVFGVEPMPEPAGPWHFEAVQGGECLASQRGLLTRHVDVMFNHR